MTRKQLVEQIFFKKSFLCVGLDTDMDKIPKPMRGDEDPILDFNKAIIDATAPYCVAYKPNLAFYESQGLRGMAAFESTVLYLRQSYPNHFVIADAKRGDIGNTSAMYAKTFFDWYGVDALTVAPYMGEDSISPFIANDGKWVVILALTSNDGSNDFQLMEGANGERLFEKVLTKYHEWGTDENMMYVVGSTQGSMFEDVRKLAPTNFLLVPGIGAQGGNLRDVCKYALTADCGILVNSSRDIIYASDKWDFAEAAGKKAKELQTEMEHELLLLHSIKR